MIFTKKSDFKSEQDCINFKILCKNHPDVVLKLVLGLIRERDTAIYDKQNIEINIMDIKRLKSEIEMLKNLGSDTKKTTRKARKKK